MIEEICSHVANTLGYPSLKNEQKTVLMKGNNVFAMLPTGFGKSLLRHVFDRLLGTTISAPQPIYTTYNHGRCHSCKQT